MRHNSILLLLLGMAALSAAPHAPARRLDALAWLSGCWESTGSDGRVITEHWTTPLGDMMMGVSRTVRDGKTVEYEYIRLEQSGPDTIRYIAHPSRQEEASFLLVQMDSRHAVFENLAHDFPQRIVYELITSDSLAARIEGVLGGQVNVIRFPYHRARCQ
jgi:hypothetical protein